MTEAYVELILQQARERFPHTVPRIISYKGSQFIAKDFKEFIRICGMSMCENPSIIPNMLVKVEKHFFSQLRIQFKLNKV